MKRLILAMVAISSFTMIGCGRTTLPPVPYQHPIQTHTQHPRMKTQFSPPTYKTSQYTRLLKTSKNPKVHEIRTDRLIFNGHTDFNIGDIVIGRGQKQDFLRRIVKIDFHKNQTILYTKEASIFEAFESLDARGFVPDSGIIEELNTGLSRKTFRIGEFFEIQPKFKIKPNFSNTEIHLKDKVLSIKMNPVTEIKGYLEARFVPFSTRAHVLNIFKLPELKIEERLELPGLSIPGSIGPVPVIYNISPGIALDLNSSAKGSLFMRGEMNGTISAGIELSAQLGHKPTIKISDKSWNFNAQLKQPGIRIEGEVKSKLRIPDVQFNTKVAGMVGPYLSLSPYLDGKVNGKSISHLKETTIKGLARSNLGLTVHGGLTEAKIFGYKLSKGINIKIWDKPLKKIYDQRYETVIPHPQP